MAQTQFEFVKTLYNEALVEATKVDETTFVPVITTDIRIILKWMNKNTNTLGFVRLYPNPTGDIIMEQNDAGSDVLYDDLVYNLFVTKDGKQTHNFLRQINLDRNMAEGGNRVTLTIFDPQSAIVDEAIIKTYMDQMKNENTARISMSMVYGWANTDLNVYGAPLGDDLILVDITVDVEYFGATYTLQFVDSTSNSINTTIDCWQLTPPDSQNQTTTTSGASGETTITFPQAYIEAWKMMHKAKKDEFGNKGKYYILTNNTDETFLSQSVYEGDTTKWLGKKKSFSDWNPGKAPFKTWISDQLKLDYPDSAKAKYMFKEFTVGSFLLGKPSDYKCFTGEMWIGLDSLFPSDEFHANSDGFRVPQNTSFWAIVVDTFQAVAHTDTIPGKNVVLRYYVYATPIRSPHATVIKFDIDTNNVLSLYMARQGSANVSKTKVPESDNPTDKSITTGTQTLASDSNAGCKPSPQQDSPATPSANTEEKPEEALQSMNEVAMLSIEATIEVLGDPILSTMLGFYVGIDFDEYSPAMLPWVRGLYMVTQISETLSEGLWTHQLKLIKVGELPESVKLNDTTGLVEAPTSASINIIPREYALSFLKITNYLEWLLGALGIASILGNLIGGIISELNSIYSGVLGLFSNEELANISNTIQNTAGGKNYNNPQNLGATSSQNSIQQYYDSQTQTTREILTNYCENFAKMDDIEDVQARKDIALLATKFGGDMVRKEVLDMANNSEEITMETVKNRLISRRKWYRTGDRNFVVNVNNFAIKKLKIPLQTESVITN